MHEGPIPKRSLAPAIFPVPPFRKLVILLVMTMTVAWKESICSKKGLHGWAESKAILRLTHDFDES